MPDKLNYLEEIYENKT